MNTIITIDGPSGAGKTVVAARVAKELGLPCLPSGALYRAAAWAFLQLGGTLEDKKAASAFIATFTPVITDNGRIFYNDQDISELIQGGDIGLAAATIALYPEVRDRLTLFQQEFGRVKGCVIEGRSTAIEIFPDATVKLWLTADLETRLKRKRQAATTLQARDAIDRERLLAPMQIAEGAIEVDSTQKTVDEVVEEITAYCRQKQLH